MCYELLKKILCLQKNKKKKNRKLRKVYHSSFVCLWWALGRCTLILSMQSLKADLF